MISLIYLIFRLTLLAAFTFLFVVLYEHGPSGFKEGVNVEWAKIVKLASSFQSSKPAPATPAATPAPAVAATPRPLSTPVPAQPAPEPVTDSVAESAPVAAPQDPVPSTPSEYVPAPPPTVNTTTGSTGSSSSSSVAPTPRSASSQAPSAWRELQKKEIGAPSSGTPRPKKNISTDDQ